MFLRWTWPVPSSFLAPTTTVAGTHHWQKISNPQTEICFAFNQIFFGQGITMCFEGFEQTENQNRTTRLERNRMNQWKKQKHPRLSRLGQRVEMNPLNDSLSQDVTWLMASTAIKTCPLVRLLYQSFDDHIYSRRWGELSHRSEMCSEDICNQNGVKTAQLGAGVDRRTVQAGQRRR